MLKLKYDLKLKDEGLEFKHRSKLEDGLKEITHIEGPNSSGKSTLLHIIAIAFNLQNNDGIVPRFYIDGVPNYNERVDALAQAVRMAIIHVSEGRLDKSYINKAKKTLSLILKYQAINDDIRINGGFYWGKTSKGVISKDVNSWVTAFFIQAALLTTDYMKNKWDINPFHLI